MTFGKHITRVFIKQW